MTLRRIALPMMLAATAIAAASAQPRPAVTASDYARAEKFLAANLQGLVAGGSVTPVWMANDRFWYRNQTASGTEIVVVDPAKRTRAVFSDCAAASVDCAGAPADSGGRGGRGGGG